MLLLRIACLRIGLSTYDIYRSDVGELLDIIITFNNVNDADQSDSRKVRQATQRDFDRF